MNGNPIKCYTTSGCSLHLHGAASPNVQPNFEMANPSAPGLAMAVGNTGASLSAYDQGDTYLTNDAGLTWRMVRKGAHMHAFGDHGAVVVIVNDEDPTSHVRYSWDMGQTWANFDFLDGDKVRSISC